MPTHVWNAPESRVTAELLLGMGISSGDSLSTWVPSPSCPCQLLPQHITDLLLITAHVWYEPAAIAIACAPPRSTETGACLFVVVPSPSCPFVFSPQHFMLPSSSNAHVCDSPVVTAKAVLPGPRSAFLGKMLSSVEPSPS